MENSTEHLNPPASVSEYYNTHIENSSVNPPASVSEYYNAHIENSNMNSSDPVSGSLTAYDKNSEANLNSSDSASKHLELYKKNFEACLKVYDAAFESYLNSSDEVQYYMRLAERIFEQVLTYTLVSYFTEDVKKLYKPIFKQSNFPLIIGEVVELLMDDHRCTDVFKEIVEIEIDTREADDSSESLHKFLEDKIMRFGTYLSEGDDLNCLRYIAIISELCITFHINKRDERLVYKIANIAKENLHIYAEINKYYVDLEDTATEYLNDFLK